MKLQYGLVLALGFMTGMPAIGHAQDVTREAGGEFGFDVLYEFSKDIRFEGGSSLDKSDDFGVALSFGYRFNPKWELQFMIDWNDIDYNGTLQSASFPGLSADISGTMELFTPKVNGVYNFMNGPITPFVTAGIGWSFIDTNIPTGQVQVGCWWDPWWGQVCTPYQPTKDTDAFTYQVGGGVRWDVADFLSLKLIYERTWYDLNHATSDPGVDQIRVGLAWLY
ncbi:MAG: outer membrane beta-barrel protein [Steroidobacteraceae bacterium]|nr:outer membrane beta-barrel protein [Steroidobacteraceae bacterium]